MHFLVLIFVLCFSTFFERNAPVVLVDLLAISLVLLGDEKNKQIPKSRHTL